MANPNDYRNAASPATRADSDLLIQRRASTAAALGLGMQLLLGVLAYVLWVLARAVPTSAIFTFTVAGVVPWLAVMIAVAFRKARTVEEFELEAARRSGEAARTIFESEYDARPAARRLARVYKYVLPAAAILLGLILTFIGFIEFRAVAELADLNYRISNPRLVAGLAAGFAFVGFVLGRYLLGMSANPAWSLLRGGATYLIGTVYLLGLLAIAAGARGLGTDAANAVLRWVVPLFMMIVGVEVLLNVVLDLYRPKTAEETPRPAFDSRLLNLLASPGGVVRSLNEAVNYQFGFEITQSWFWRLLSRSFIWLVLFGVSVLVLLSSVVVIAPYEMGLATRFGRLDEQPLEPGIHLKMPWPISTVDRYPVTRVEQMVVGSHDELHPHPTILWTNQHAEDERLLVVATDSDGTAATDGAAGGPSVGLAAAEVFVQWRIDPENLVNFATSSANPAYRLRQIAETSLARAMLQYDIDAAVGPARTEISETIARSVRDVVERENLGVEVLWVGLAGVHPAQAVAEDFNQSIAAEQQRLQLREEGLREQTRVLTRAAGSVEAAQRIVEERQRLDQLRQQLQAGTATEEAVVAQESLVSRLVQEAGGDAAEALLVARADRWQRQNAAAANAALVPVQYAAYQRAPGYFKARSYLEMLKATMSDKPKTMIVAEVLEPLFDFDYRQTLGALSGISIPQRDEPAGQQ